MKKMMLALALLLIAVPAYADIDFNNEPSDFTTDCESYPNLGVCKNNKLPKQLTGEELEDYLADRAEKEFEEKQNELDRQREILEAEQDLAKEQEE